MKKTCVNSFQTLSTFFLGPTRNWFRTSLGSMSYTVPFGDWIPSQSLLMKAELGSGDPATENDGCDGVDI